MRSTKALIFILTVLILQTAIFSRLSFLGSMPDLILVSVIAFAVIEEQVPAAGFAALAGILQDVLSAGIYLNLLVKVLASNLVSFVKQKFIGDEMFLAGMMVAACTGLILVLQYLTYYFVFGRQFSFWAFIFRLLFETAANLLLTPIVFSILRDKIIGKS